MVKVNSYETGHLKRVLGFILSNGHSPQIRRIRANVSNVSSVECIESGEKGWRMSGECMESGQSGWRIWRI